MEVIKIRNVQCALPEGIRKLQCMGILEDSRNGPVVRCVEPVTTVYSRPMERVVFYELRDANPFFHFMESLWMLAGRNDVEWLAYFNANIANYSDDGEKFHGAYGYRWRKHFEGDQLMDIARALKANHDCRRQVLQIWDACDDLGRCSKDLPCNLTVHFQIGGTRIRPVLNMTVFNRSNDVVWGAYGANAVHFSMLQEYMANKIDVDVGKYYQISDNFHVYRDIMDKRGWWGLSQWCPDVMSCEGFNDPYTFGEVLPFPLGASGVEWDQDLSGFFTLGTSAMGYRTPFFRKVVLPMMNAWELYKDNELEAAVVACNRIAALDWRKACQEWLTRRLTKRRDS
jgi:hypothetical protein